MVTAPEISQVGGSSLKINTTTHASGEKEKKKRIHMKTYKYRLGSKFKMNSRLTKCMGGGKMLCRGRGTHAVGTCY
jgi:hypothetical protein